MKKQFIYMTIIFTMLGLNSCTKEETTEISPTRMNSFTAKIGGATYTFESMGIISENNAVIELGGISFGSSGGSETAIIKLKILRYRTGTEDFYYMDMSPGIISVENLQIFGKNYITDFKTFSASDDYSYNVSANSSSIFSGTFLQTLKNSVDSNDTIQITDANLYFNF